MQDAAGSEGPHSVNPTIAQVHFRQGWLIDRLPQALTLTSNHPYALHARLLYTSRRGREGIKISLIWRAAISSA